MTAGTTLIRLTDEVASLARLFVEQKVMPGPESSGDAVHLAAATAHEVQYLLSWNVRHLANPNKVQHLDAVCRQAGVTPPIIITPEVLWETE